MNGFDIQEWKGAGAKSTLMSENFVFVIKEDLGSKVKGFVPAFVLLAISKHEQISIG